MRLYLRYLPADRAARPGTAPRTSEVPKRVDAQRAQDLFLGEIGQSLIQQDPARIVLARRIDGGPP
jgi:hypothetical protein